MMCDWEDTLDRLNQALDLINGISVMPDDEFELLFSDAQDILERSVEIAMKGVRDYNV